MPKLACLSVDLDGLSHYCRLHGLDERELPPGGATAEATSIPVPRAATTARCIAPG